VTRRSSRRLAGTLLVILPGIALTFSSVLKFAGIPAVTAQMAEIGFAGGKLLFIAALEIVSAALFLWPRTRSIGLLLVASYLGGAICAHVQSGEFAKAVSPAALLGLAFLGVWLRHPEMLWSLRAAPEEA
jgi:hypothetical protein